MSLQNLDIVSFLLLYKDSLLLYMDFLIVI